MKIKSIFSLIVMFLVVMDISAQQLTVLDAETRQALPFVSVSAMNPNVSGITDSRGKIELQQFKDAEILYFNLLGYASKEVEVSRLTDKKYMVLMRPTEVRLDEVVVSATRWAQSRREITQKISSFNASEISLASPQTAADLLGSGGEVFIQKSQQGGGSPMIRGFATNRLLIVVDGVRMNNAIFRSGNLQNIISIDPMTVQSAEVLFGPGSVMYGSDAIGGVMAFSTLQPLLSDTDHTMVKGAASVRYSSANNEISPHMHVAIGGKKWASISSFSFNQFGDLRMGSNGGQDSYLRTMYAQRINNLDQVVSNADPLLQKFTAYSQQNFVQKIRFSPTEKWDLNYAFHYSTTTDNPRYDRLIRTRNDLPRSAEWYYGPQLWLMHHVKVRHYANTSLFDEIQVNAAMQQFAESRHDRDFGKTTKYHRYEEVDAWSLNADFIKQWDNRSKLSYGIEAVYNDVLSTGEDEDISDGSITPGPSRYPQASWSTFAAFASFQQQLAPKLILQSGLRFSYFNLSAKFDTTFYPFPFVDAQLDKGALNGSLGILFLPDDQTTISVNASTGFRAPNVDDMGKLFDSEPGSVLVPNAALKPEYAWNADFGLARTMNENFRIDFSAFYTLLTNALVRRDFQLNGMDSILYAGELSKVLAIQNAAKAKVYGIQAGAEWKLPMGFSLYSNITWQKGEEELDDGSSSPLRHAAPLFGLSRLRYTLPNVTLELNARYSAAVSFEEMPEEEKAKTYMYATDADGNPYSPAWYTLNFKVLVKAGEQLSLNGGIENITDQRFRPYSSGMVAAGRNLIFGLQYRF